MWGICLLMTCIQLTRTTVCGWKGLRSGYDKLYFSKVISSLWLVENRCLLQEAVIGLTTLGSILLTVFECLQLSDEFTKSSLVLGSEDDVMWRRPVTLVELLALKKQYPDSQIAAGSSNIGT